MSEALVRFLSVAASLVTAQGHAAVGRWLKLASIAVRAGDTGRDALREATATMQALVDEGRPMTPEEDAALDASIENKLARAAAVDLGDEG